MCLCVSISYHVTFVSFDFSSFVRVFVLFFAFGLPPLAFGLPLSLLATVDLLCAIVPRRIALVGGKVRAVHVLMCALLRENAVGMHDVCLSSCLHYCD